MSMPGLTAAGSLCQTHGRYRVGGQARRMIGAIYPMMAIIEIHDCPPGHLRIGDLGDENIVCIPITPGGGGHEGPSPPEPPINGDGGNGGGGADSGGGTKNMDKACNPDPGTHCPIGSPSTSTRCALAKCRIDYCKGHACTADELALKNTAENTFRDLQCTGKECRTQSRSAFTGVRRFLSARQ